MWLNLALMALAHQLNTFVNSMDTKKYVVKRSEDEAIVINDFIYPWKGAKSTDLKFTGWHTEKWLHLTFRVNCLKPNVFTHSHYKMEVAWSDRVEIFFRKDDKLTPYYCLEIDPLARVLDYKANYYRQFDYEWSWPKDHLKISTFTGKDGYDVNISITKESLESLGLLNNNHFEAGLFRGECIKLNGENPEMEWISWVSPNSRHPDFHIPSSFGKLELE